MATAIQFLRSSTPRLRPNPADLASGMPMVNIAPEEPGLYFKTSDSKLFKVGPTFIGTVPPNDGATGFAGNTIGEQWLDVTDPDTPILKIWDGLVWKEVAGGGIEVETQADWNETDVDDPGFIQNKPTVLSEFTNDGDGTAPFVTESSITNILAGNNPDGTPNPSAPTYVQVGDNTSVLTNDGEGDGSPFITEAGVANVIEGKNPDGSTPPGGILAYLQSGDNVSELVNDAGYLDEAEVNNVLLGLNPDGTTPGGGVGPTYLKAGDDNTELVNAAGYLDEAEVNNVLLGLNPDGSTPGGGVGPTYLKSGDNNTELVNSAGYLVESEVNNLLLGLNPDGTTPGGGVGPAYLKSGDNVSELANDAGYLDESEVNNVLLGLNPDGTTPIGGANPSFLKAGDNVSELANDANYIDAAGAPVQSVNTKVGAVVLNLDDVNDVSVSGAITNNVLVYNGASWEAGAGVSAPSTTELKGTFDVSDINDLPGSPSIGDTYIQQSPTAGQTVTADPAWPNIGGDSVDDGAFVFYADVAGVGTWVVGNNNVSSFQADWTETNSSSNSFIQNKPDVNDVTVTIKDSDLNPVGSFTTNQNTASDITLPAPPTVGDATITIKENDGTEVGSFTTNQGTNADITLPVIPEVNDGTITIKESDGTTIGSFTTNQNANQDVTLPAYPVVYNSTVTVQDANGTQIGTFTTNQATNSDIVIPVAETPNDAALTLTVNANGTTTNTVFTANASQPKSLTIGAGTLTIKGSDGSNVGTFSANQSTDVELNLPAGMIEPTVNGRHTRKKNTDGTFEWNKANLQNITAEGSSTNKTITFKGGVSSEIDGAANGSYGAGFGTTPTGNLMPLDIRKLPPLPTTRVVTTLNYSVTVNNPGDGNIYYLNGNAQQEIVVSVGDTIVFDYSDDSNAGHSLSIYSDEALTTVVTSGVTDDAESETLTYVVDTEGTFYYDCVNHPGMGSTIIVSI